MLSEVVGRGRGLFESAESAHGHRALVRVVDVSWLRLFDERFLFSLRSRAGCAHLSDAKRRTDFWATVPWGGIIWDECALGGAGCSTRRQTGGAMRVAHLAAGN